MTSSYDDYWELLFEFESIPDISKSIFDITGYPHYENVSSNILAFYLNPNNEHGLGNLLYSSLLNLLGGNESQPDNVQNEFMSKLYNRVGELKKLMKKKPDKCVKLWVHAKSCLVHVFKLSGHSIEFDLCISPKGWELRLYGQNKNSQSYLSELLNTPPLNEYKPCSMKNSEYILEHYNLADDLDEIKDKLLKWFDLLLQSEKNKRKS